MKIKKFNEKYFDSKLPDYLKNTLLEEYLEKNLELAYIRDKIKILVIEWSIFNKDYLNRKYDFYNTVDNFNMYGDYSFSLHTKNNVLIDLDEKDIKDLVTYIENPDFYKDTKNFNL